MREMGVDTDAMDLEGDSCQRIVKSMWKGREFTFSHPAPESLSKVVSINVHTACNVERSIWGSTILMGFNPLETELEVKTIETVGNLADDVDIMTHSSALGTSFLGAVDFGDGGTVINPENDTAG
jgi:hypothetical protein